MEGHFQVYKEISVQKLLFLFNVALVPFREFLWSTLRYASDELFQEIQMMLSYFQVNFDSEFRKLIVPDTFDPLAQFLMKSALKCRTVYNFMATKLVSSNMVQQIYRRCSNWYEELMSRQVLVGLKTKVEGRFRRRTSQRRFGSFASFQTS